MPFPERDHSKGPPARSEVGVYDRRAARHNTPLVLTNRESHTCRDFIDDLCVDCAIPYVLTDLGRAECARTRRASYCSAHTWNYDQVDQLLYCAYCGALQELNWQRGQPVTYGRPR